MSEKVLVLGASLITERYSNIAINMLLDYDHQVIAVGKRKGNIRGVEISNQMDLYTNIDTVTLYLNPDNQVPFKSYIKNLRPKRVIFNPGTENPEFVSDLNKLGIQTEIACTLVLLRTDQFSISID